MSTIQDFENESDDYRESEDEDFNPNEGANDLSDEEDIKEVKKLDQLYTKYQGRGGVIKTRAQRLRETQNTDKVAKPDSQPIVGKSSIDIDALWGEMNKPNQSKENKKCTDNDKDLDPKVSQPIDENLKKDIPDESNCDKSEKEPSNSRSQALQEEYIEIKRTFKFAGEVKTETKRVLKSSAEGQHFLNQQKEQQKQKSQGRAPVKRKMSLEEEYNMNKTKKINTLEKSRLDWLGFVDKEDIRDDLTKHNKAGYLDRQGFLNSVDQKLENDIRRQRTKSLQ